MARGTWADAVRVREGRRALERRRGDPFVRTKRNSVSASLYTRYSQRVICNASVVWADVTAKMDSPPLVDFSPVTGPHPLNHPLGGP